MTLRSDSDGICTQCGEGHFGACQQPDNSTFHLAADALHVVLTEIGHPVALMSLEGRILQFNGAMGQLLNYENRVGIVSQFVTPDVLREVVRLGRPQQRELHGFGRWWHVHLVPLRDQREQVMQLLLLAQDITTIKDAQQAALSHQQSLTAVLSREIHHRVKNHLQGLIGLLRTHAGSQQPAGRIIDTAVAHVLSIATVHGLLAESNQAVELSQLVENIIGSMQAESRLPLTFSLVSAPWHDVVLSQEDAVPFAVSIAELLTNAMKHTAASADAGVEVTLMRTTDSAKLCIRNHPARLLEGFALPDKASTPSGLVMIQTLLPRSRTHLALAQRGDAVVTTLRITLAAAVNSD